MEIKTMLLIVAAVTVAIGAAGVAFKFVGGNRRAPGPAVNDGAGQTKLMIKLIILGLVLFLGLAVYLLYEIGGG